MGTRKHETASESLSKILKATPIEGVVAFFWPRQQRPSFVGHS